MGGTLQRLPEIGGGAVAIGMRGHVGADAVAKRRLAEVIFQHADQRLTLVVSDGVERHHRLALVGDRLLDRVRSTPRVESQGILLLGVPVQPALPLRVKLLRGLGRHPGRKTFVEPEIIPPRHGDEIAEPLMRHFMRDDAEDAAPRAIRIGRGIEQQPALEKGDAAPVLHGAAKAAGHRDQVELGQRIFDAEIIVEPGQELHSAVEGELPLRGLARGGDDPDRDAVHLRGDPLQLAHRQDEQVARHFRGGCESDLFQVRLQRLLAHHRHVADREEIPRHRYRQREARLEGGLVPARKYPPRVRRFELAGEQALHAAIGRIIDKEEAAIEFVDLRGKFDAEPVRACGKRLRKGERGGLGTGIERDVRARRTVVDGDGCKRRVDGVERQPRGGRADLDVDDFHAG